MIQFLLSLSHEEGVGAVLAIDGAIDGIGDEESIEYIMIPIHCSSIWNQYLK